MIDKPLFSMDTAPRDGSVILAYHIIWKVPVCIKYVDKLNGWADSLITTQWPEEAFMGWRYINEFDL